MFCKGVLFNIAAASFVLSLGSIPAGISEAGQMKVLAEGTCEPAGASTYAGSWPPEWQVFRSFSKACPLNPTPGHRVRTWLLSVWASDYLSAHPDVNEWPPFPRSQIVDDAGRCLAVLPELYPFDEPRDLTLAYELSGDGIPRSIRVRVDNPAVGGHYTLPVLLWNDIARRYVAKSSTSEHATEESRCPN